jgi:hypothetical protein
MTDIVPAEVVATSDVPATWVAAMKLAGRIHATPFVPASMRGKPEVVLACILMGDELGIGPMQSLNSIHVIDGRPAAAPELMRALVNRAGHKFTVDHADNDKVTVSGVRRDTQASASVTWTMADARTAKLAGRGAWVTYPRAMLLARATSELCRMLFSDCVKGLSYTPEEVAHIDGNVWEPVGELTDPVTDRQVSVPVDVLEDGDEPRIDHEWDDHQ